jgi:predicted DNA-binding antitoxin AbrB/MazE fold protein
MAMTITVAATYENGVLRPAQPLALAEHAQVRVTVEERVQADNSTEQT